MRASEASGTGPAAIATTTIRESSPAPPLGQLLPIIRTLPTTLRSPNLKTEHVLGLSADQLVIFEKRRRAPITPDAFEPDGLINLLAVPSVDSKWVARVSDISSAILGPTRLGARELCFQARHETPTTVVLPNDDPVLFAALRELLGERFSIDPLKPVSRRLPESSAARRIRVTAGIALACAIFCAEGVAAFQASLLARVAWTAAWTFVALVGIASLTASVRPSRAVSWIQKHLVTNHLNWRPRVALQSRTLGLLLRIVGAFAAVGGLAAANVLWLLLTDRISFNTARHLGGLYYFLLPFFLAPATVLIVVGYRLSQRGGNPATTSDKRPPVVFLRSFSDDGRATLNPPGGLPQLFGLEPIEGLRVLGPLANVNPLRLLRLVLALATDTAEEQLATVFRSVGPFVAIGKPGELLRPGGAARIYVENSVWQQEVRRLIEAANLVVIQPDVSAGVWWELEVTLRNVARSRILLSLAHCQRAPEHWESIRLRLEPLLGVALPRAASKAVFICFDEDGSPVHIRPVFNNPLVWPIVGSAVNVRFTLEAFLDRLRDSTTPFNSDESYSPGAVEIAFALGCWFLVGWAFDWVLVQGVIALIPFLM